MTINQVIYICVSDIPTCLETLKKNDNKIRLAFVISSNLREWAGMEHVLYQYCINKPEGIDIVIFEPESALNPRISEEKVKELFKDCTIRNFKGYFNKLSSLEKSDIGKVLTEIIFIPVLAILLKYTFLRELRSQLGQFDVVYFFNPNREPKLLGRGKQILIGSTHAWFPGNSNLFKRLELKLLVDGLIMRNLNYFHFFPSQFNLLKSEQRERFFSIPNGVDSERFVPNEREESNIKFLFLARLEECKGILTVIQAFKRLQTDKDIELHIVGSGTLSSQIERESGGRIYLHGFVSEDDLPNVISSCDIFVYPSRCDTFSLVVLNALSCGLHVITTTEISGNFNPMSEAGFITTTRPEIEDTANAMQRAIKNIESIRTNKIKCHNMVAEKYDWKKITDEFYAGVGHNYFLPFS